MQKTFSPFWFLIAKLGANRVHSCSTVPITWPGGEETSIDCKQHGKQQVWQANGRLMWITSFLCASNTLISNGRALPQQFLVQQSLSSLAQYTWYINGEKIKSFLPNEMSKIQLHFARSNFWWCTDCLFQSQWTLPKLPLFAWPATDWFESNILSQEGNRELEVGASN